MSLSPLFCVVFPRWRQVYRIV